MNTRERFQAIMNFRPFDRLPLLEWAGWWDKTIERWHAEGLPATITDRYEIVAHFGLDLYLQDWLQVYTPDCPGPASHGAPLVATEAEYLAFRSFLYPGNTCDEARWTRWAELQARGEAVLWITLLGPFWFPRTLLGIAPHLYAFYDQPALMHRMNRDLAEWNIKAVETLCRICRPDYMTFAEDMSYNHGPMVSKELFDEFLAPYYRMQVPVLDEHGIVPIVDSDGDITVPAAWFEAVGIQGILPLERQAGVDMAVLRAAHPRMKFIGHFDKMTMNRGEAVLRGEFERLLPIASKGGFLVGCDHQTPPGVSYNDYQLYLSLFREYGAEAGRRSVALKGSCAGATSPARK